MTMIPPGQLYSPSPSCKKGMSPDELQSYLKKQKDRKEAEFGDLRGGGERVKELEQLKSKPRQSKASRLMKEDGRIGVSLTLIEIEL